MHHLDQHTLKSFLYGLIYLVGVPLAIVFTFIIVIGIVIGIPIGLLLFVLYIFSLIIGHLVAAVLLAHYINQKNKNDWSIWTLSFLAVGLAAVLRIITITPFVGFLMSIVPIAMAYGLIGITLLQCKGDAKLLA